jgi:membrane protein YqaA with SNARE-associated domain
MPANIIAFIWGLAEATVFFIVPDVALSVIALNGVDIGLIACLYALCGALVGGTIMFYWGRADVEKVTRVLKMIPAIRPKDIEKVRSDLKKSGIITILFGPILGIPYKIYAAYAHVTTPIYYFLLITIPARIVRFVLVTFVTPYIVNIFSPDAPFKSQVRVVLIIWTVFYTIYFILKRK